MTAPTAQSDSLSDIRREIDRIDDGILALVAERLAMADRVKRVKADNGGAQQTPLRPAREAAVMRRLIERAKGKVPAELCFRLWRTLIASAALRQAPVRIHASAGLFASPTAQSLLREFFGQIAFADHPGEVVALKACAVNAFDLAAVAIESAWVRPFRDGAAGKAQVIGCLPFLSGNAAPKILIFGHAAQEPTGDDETLVMTNGPLPRDFAPHPLWQIKSGNVQISGLPGFLSEHNAPLIGLQRSNDALALTIVGRYPSPIEIAS
jgi:chorismate mutase / prephenate dehydratase